VWQIKKMAESDHCMQGEPLGMYKLSVPEAIAQGFCNELAQMCQISGMVIFPLIFVDRTDGLVYST
jgi:hypothetical protein